MAEKERYERRNVFNPDEIRCFWRKMPRKSLVSEVSGGAWIKPSKSCISVMIWENATGTQAPVDQNNQDA